MVYRTEKNYEQLSHLTVTPKKVYATARALRKKIEEEKSKQLLFINTLQLEFHEYALARNNFQTT